MKKFVTVILGIIAFSFINVQAQSLTDSLIAYWSFDDSTANDFSGHGYHGRLINNPSPVPGVKGSAFRFVGNGVNTDMGSHILIPFIDFNKIREFTISMWVNEEDMSYWHGGGYIFFGDHSNGWLGIWNHFGNNYSDKDLKICFTVGDQLNNDLLRIKFDYNNRNKWVHYCMVYKNGTTYGYINGVMIGSKKQTVLVRGTNAAIARCWWGGGTVTATRFTGAIDEVKIYTRALTDEEVKKVDEVEQETILSANVSLCEGETFRPNDPSFGKRVDFDSCSWQVGKLNINNNSLQSSLNSLLSSFKDNPDPVISDITLDMEGTYIAKGKDKQGNNYKKTVTLKVNPKPRPTINASKTESCQPVKLFAVDTSFVKPPVSVYWSTGAKTSSITASASGIYKVYMLSADGCLDSAEINITIDKAPEAKIMASGLTNICQGDSLTLSSNVDFDYYQWSTGESTKSIIVKQSGKYSLTVTNKDSCSSTAIIDVNVVALPEVEITADGPMTICEGDSLLLTAVTGSDNGMQWQDGTTQPQKYVTSPGTYKVVVWNTIGCMDSAAAEVFVRPSVVARIKSGGPAVMCKGETMVLTAEPTGSDYRYIWSTGDTASSITVSNAGRYTLVVKSGDKCDGTAAFDVSYYPENILSVNGKNKICTGDSALLTANGKFLLYKWSTGETSPQIIVRNEGDYSLEATDSNGCQATASFTVRVIPLPEPIVQAVTYNNCNSDSAKLKTTEQYASYQWYNADNGELIGSDTSVLIRASGNYFVSVTNEAGCKGISGTSRVMLNTDSNRIEILENFEAGEYIFGQVHYGQESCRQIKFRNRGARPFTLDNASLVINKSYSIPQGQFPIEIPAGEARELTVCFSPVDLGLSLDTLILFDTCSPHRIPMRATGEPNDYEGESRCQVPVHLRTVAIKSDEDYLDGYVYPNPAGKETQVDIFTSRGGLVSLNLYNSTGQKVYAEEFESKSKSTVNRTLDFSNLSDGIYQLVVYNSNKTVNLQLIIIK